MTLPMQNVTVTVSGVSIGGIQRYRPHPDRGWPVYKLWAMAADRFSTLEDFNIRLPVVV